MRKPLLYSYLVIFAILVLVASLQSGSEVLAGPNLAPPYAPGPINADVENGSGSVPQLNPGGTDWESFDANQGVPAKGGIVVQYTPVDPADFTSFPIQAGGAAVTLRPSTAGPALNCTLTVAEPVLSSSNAGQCFFRTHPDGFAIQIFYLGELQVGGDIRYTISGLAPAAGGTGTFTAFDSDTVVAGQAPTPVAGRDPARLVLVLDKSGSMAWSARPQDPGCGVFTPPPPGCEPARWEILNDALAQMLTVAKAYALPSDRFGAALFDSTVAAANSFDFTTIDPVSVNTFQAAVATRTPGGATSIGAGISEFESDLNSAGSFTQTVLLFTDGDQNTAPFLVTNATQLLINETANSPVGDIHEFAPGVVNVCPFALRADNPGGTLGTTYLQDIADRRCSGLMNSAVEVNPSDAALLQFFLQVLNGALLGDKLELASVQDGQLVESDVFTPTTEVITATHTITTSADDISFTVLINWEERFDRLVDANLVKDGVVFPLRSQPVIDIAGSLPPSSFALIEEGDTYFSVTMRQPFCNDAGECVDPEGPWEMNFVPDFEVGDTFTYNLFHIVDNATLASEFSAFQPTQGVEEPLVLQATLEEGGAPLAGLPPGSVRAIVSRPSNSLGNVLSTTGVDPVADPSADNIGTAGRKASAMLNDPTLRTHLLAALNAGLASEVPLAEVAPGVYRASYTDTEVEGVYNVNFFVDGETPSNGPFLRTYETGFYVRVVPDPAATQDSIVITPLTNCQLQGGCFSILIRPVDGAGNLLGPGKDPLLFLPAGSNAQLLEPVVDNLDGTYEMIIGFEEPIAANPVIEVAGVPIRPQIIPNEQQVCVEGSVIDHAEQLLGDGRTVSATRSSSGGGRVITRPVDATGHFTFEQGILAPGTWTFSIDVRGDEGWEPVTPAEFDVTLVPDLGACQRIRFKLRQLSTVIVTKIDIDHTPLAGWIIRAQPGPDNYFATPVEVRTDFSGTAAFSLTRGLWIFQEIAPPGTRYTPIMPPTGRQELQVRPPASYTLRFKNQVHRRGCIEVTKHDVTAELRQAPVPLPGWRIQVRRADGSVAAGGTTDAQGIVTFADLPFGPYHVVEESRIGWEPVLSSSQVVTLSEQACVPLLFENRQAPLRFCIEGRVLDANGRVGLPGWNITATPVYTGGYQPADQVTDGEGSFRFVFQDGDYRIPGASYNVCAERKPGWFPHTPLCRRVTLPHWPGACIHVVFVNQQAGHSFDSSK